MSIRRYPPRRRYRLDFRELMRLCEENYAHLGPVLNALGDEDRARFVLPAGPGDELECEVRVLERARYTTVLRLEQDAVHEMLPPARVTVRLYHDARMAEVTEALPFRSVKARHSYPNAWMHQEDEKSQWNRFLAEWLVHLRQHGGSRNGLANWRALPVKS
jgi:hypothetical protein